MADTVSPPVTPSRTQRKIEVDFVVEVNNAYNRSVVWPLDPGRVLRGRWTRDNLPGVVIDESLAKMPNLPGLCLSVKDRVGTIYDPLASPKNIAMLEAAQRAAQQSPAIAVKYVPEKETAAKLDDGGIKSWCYWIRRMLDNKDVKVVAGKVPEMEEIMSWPGEMTCNVHDTTGTQQKTRVNHPYSAPPEADQSPSGVVSLTPDEAISGSRFDDDEE